MGLSEAQRKCLTAIREIDDILSRNNLWYCLSYGSALGAYREKGFIEWDCDVDLIIQRPDQHTISQLLAEELSDDFELVSYDKDSINGFDIVQIKGIPASVMHIDIYPMIGAPDDLEKAYSFMLRCRRIHRILECKYLDLERLARWWKKPVVILLKMIELLIPDSILRQSFEKMKDRYPFSTSRYFFPIGNDGNKNEIMGADTILHTRRIDFEGIMLPVPKDTEYYLRCLYGDDFMIPKQV